MKLLKVAAALFAFALYFQTIHYDYTLDDHITVTGNYLVKEGVSGIPGILKSSYLHGYWSNPDNIYRPLSLILFAVEWQFFPNNPTAAHLVNVLLFALSGVVLFNLLIKLFNNKSQGIASLIAFIATMLWLAHPVHTEVVANIKSADEILAFLFGILGISWLIDAVQKNPSAPLRERGKMLMSAGAFLLSLLAKESAVTLIAVVPLVLYFFCNTDIKKSFLYTTPLTFAAAIYFLLRMMALHGVEATSPVDKSINILSGAPFFAERLPTAIYVLGRYLWLLFFPAHLSIDYSYPEIKLLSFSDYRVLLSLAVYIGIILFAVKQFSRKNAIAFGTFFFLVTISIVSNIVLLIGTVMSERLLYMPSLGFCIVVAVLLSKLIKKEENKTFSIQTFLKINKPALIVLLVVAFLYSFKTIDRSKVWRDNLSLYKSGVKDSPLSSRVHYYYGGELNNVAAKEKYATQRQLLLDSSVHELQRAIAGAPEANPDYYHALGFVYSRKGDYRMAMQYYDEALRRVPDNETFLTDKASVLMRFGQTQEALKLLNLALARNPNDAEALINRGVCYSMINQPDSTIADLDRALQLRPADGGAWFVRAKAYSNKGMTDRAISDLNQSIKLKPDQDKAYDLRFRIRLQQRDSIGAADDINALINYGTRDKKSLSSLYLALADIYSTLHREAECDSSYEAALRFDPFNVEALYYYAFRLASRNGDVGKAEALSRRAVDLLPINCYFLDTYGWILYNEKKYGEAKEWISRSMKNGGDTVPGIREHWQTVKLMK